MNTLSLSQLPLFPLQTVLFPGGWLPLRVFEVRYLDMVRRCHKVGAPFGVVCLKQGSEMATAPRPGTPPAPTAFADLAHSVGTLAVIDTLTQPQPGLLHIHCKGTQRFQVKKARLLRHGLWVADVEMLPADLPAPVPDELADTVSSLQKLLAALQTQTSQTQNLPIQPPLAWNDAGWVANRWCDLLPVSADLKQRLMSLDNPLVRLELVSDVLEKLRLDSGR